MTPEFPKLNPILERAIAEIRDEAIPDELLESAAARVWERLAESSAPLRTCSDFQALLPEFRAGRLSESRALLLQDHLHECVACRKALVRNAQNLSSASFRPLAVPSEPRSRPASLRYAMAAGIIAAAGLLAWFSLTRFGTGSGHLIVQSVHGALYEISPAGVRGIKTGESLRDGLEIRTGPASSAVLALGDGSRIEMAQRSDLSTFRENTSLTVHLDRGNIIVQAAHHRAGHLYIAAPDCRVAVTGTVFGVSAGLKGSRISVVQGEVRVSQNQSEHVLHPGQQFSTTPSLEPVAFKEDFAWSRNPALVAQLASFRQNWPPMGVPAVRYSSKLLGLLPASTVFYASIPNLAEYFAEARSVFERKSRENSDLRAWLAGPSGPGAAVLPVIEKLRAANEYLGDEIVVFGTAETAGPVFLAEVKRDGFAGFLRESGLPLAVENRGRFVLFGPNREALAVPLDGRFERTPFYERIAAAYRQGAGLLLCADLARMSSAPVAPGAAPAVLSPPPRGLRYLIAEQRAVEQHVETRAAISFANPRTGIAGWLSAPSPMGTLDYISPEAAFVIAFSLNNPAAILDEFPAPSPQPLTPGSLPAPGLRPLAPGSQTPGTAPALPTAAVDSLGGEFALAMDGPVLPVPSWKLIAEVYDATRLQNAIQEAAAAHNLRMAQETVGGHTFYAVRTPDSNALTEAHYTFASGYLIAAPTRALVMRALEVQTSGRGIARSPGFLAMLPRDHYTNVSALLYQNFGTTLAPFAALLGPKRGGPGLASAKPMLIAAYAESDRIALASTGDLLGMSLNNFVTGSVFGLANNLAPLGQALGTISGLFASR